MGGGDWILALLDELQRTGQDRFFSRFSEGLTVQRFSTQHG